MIETNTIANEQIDSVNTLDHIIITCMIQFEQSLKQNINSHLWSPVLAFTILTVHLWNLLLSTVRNQHHNSNHVDKIIKRMKK